MHQECHCRACSLLGSRATGRSTRRILEAVLQADREDYADFVDHGGYRVTTSSLQYHEDRIKRLIALFDMPLATYINRSTNSIHIRKVTR